MRALEFRELLAIYTRFTSLLELYLIFENAMLLLGGVLGHRNAIQPIENEQYCILGIPVALVSVIGQSWPEDSH